MKLCLKYDINIIVKKTIKDQLDNLGVEYVINGIGEIAFKTPPDFSTIEEIKSLLEVYGITIIDDQKSAIVQRIKDAITEMIIDSSIENQYTTSIYLSNKLGHSYSYLSNVFSEQTYSSIENFTILKRIDYAKSLILEDKLTLTEIAHTLGYSSVAHLSSQFKKTTGLTPTVFQRIIKERKKALRAL